MKKIILAAMFVFATIATQAQDFTYFAKAGFNLSTITGTSGDSKFNTGFKIGAGMDYAFSDTWSLRPTLYFANKGGTLKYNDSNLSTKSQIDVDSYYFELPVMLALHVATSEYTELVLTGGAYAAVGVGGQTEIRLTDENGVSTTKKDDTFGKDKCIKRFDFGLGCGAAYSFSKFVVGVDAEWGLTKVLQNDDGKNLVFSLNIGYRF